MAKEKQGWIYKLMHGKKVVYVGQSIRASILPRILEHSRDKVFDSYEAYKCPVLELSEEERKLIIALSPKYNKGHNSSYCHKYGVNIRHLDNEGQQLFSELKLRVAIQPETAKDSDEFKAWNDYKLSKES